ASTLYRTFLLTAIVVLTLLGLALRLPAFLALAAAWSGLLAVSWILARRPLEGITARRELYPSAFEGDEVPVEIALRGDRGARRTEVTGGCGPSGGVEQGMLDAGPLEPGMEPRLKYVSSCSRHWGTHRVGPIRIVSSDPAGLFRASTLLPVVEEFAVFPQVY